MKEHFVDYETSLRLKNLGFDEPCFGYYDWSNRLIYTFNKEGCTNDNVAKHYIIAPLYQQVIDWLDSKNIILQPTLIRQFFPNEWGYDIAVSGANYSRVYDEDESYTTRQEALNAGIDKCLIILEQQLKS